MKKKVIIILSLFVFMFTLIFLIDLKKVSKEKRKIVKKINVSQKICPNKSYFSYVVKEPAPVTSEVSDDESINKVESTAISETVDKNEDVFQDTAEDEAVTDGVTDEANEIKADDVNNLEEEQTDVKEISENQNTKDDSLANSSEANNKEIVVSSDSPVKSEEFASKNMVNEEPKPKGYYSPNGKYLGDTNVKVIDVSYYQGNIDWDTFVRDSNCYGVILRIGYWNVEDANFKSYIEAVRRLNIPYGIYVFSYAGNSYDAKVESDFTNMMIDKYSLTPTLGIYYDIESWKVNDVSSDDLTQSDYDNIINTFVQNVNMHVSNNYKVGVYASTWYALNRLGDASRSYVDWVAEWNSTCNYSNPYTLWQYTSNAYEPGISGAVDESYLK